MSKKAVYVFIISMSAIFLLAGKCDSPPTKPPPKPESSFTLNISQKTLEIQLGQSKSLMLTIKPKDGFNEDVKLSLVAGPSTITGVFSPNPTTGSSQINIKIDNTATVKSYNLFIKGKSTSSDKSATIPLTIKVLPLPGISVTGIVLDNNREVVKNAVVSIDGKVKNTNSEGKFEFGQVETPYDLIVIPKASKTAYIYKGLNRPDPYIYLTNLFQDANNFTKISGSLSGGGGFPNKADSIAVVAFTNDKGNGYTTINPHAGPNYGLLSANWHGKSTIQGTLHALQWTRDTSANLKPLNYLGYGTKTVALKAGVVANYNIVLKTVTSSAISGNIKLPTGYSLFAKALYLQFGKQTTIPVVIETTKDPTFTYAVPNIDAAIGIQITASDGKRISHSYQANLKSTQIINFDLTPAPKLISPANNVQNIGEGSEYSWTAFEGGIHVLGIFHNSPGGQSFVIYTSDTKATLPNKELKKLGLSMPLKSDYSWLVSGLKPYSNIDSFASKNGGFGVFGLDKDINWGLSETFKFKTGD